MNDPFHILNIIRANKVRHEKHRKEIDALWKQFGASIRKHRRERKIRLNAFAKSLGYTTTMVSYMESGDRHWPIDKARKAVSLLVRKEDWPD